MSGDCVGTVLVGGMSGDCVGTVLVVGGCLVTVCGNCPGGGGMSGDCVGTVLVVGGCLVTVWELSWWWGDVW